MHTSQTARARPLTPAITLSLGIIVSLFIASVVWQILYEGYLSPLWEPLRFLCSLLASLGSAASIFWLGLRTVQVGYDGIVLILGSPQLRLASGNHWVLPLFCKVLELPSSTNPQILTIPGEKIDAQDGIPIWFGVVEDGGGENTLKYRIVHPYRFLEVSDPLGQIADAYLQGARLFFGQFSQAAGIRNERNLFIEFLALEKGADHAAFARKLEAADFPDSDGVTKPMFSPDGRQAILAEAGNFVSILARLGVQVQLQTPSVREDPSIVAANAKVEASEAEARAAQAKQASILAMQKGMKEAAVNANTAAHLAAAVHGIPGVTSNQSNFVIDLSGVDPETVKTLAPIAAAMTRMLLPNQSTQPNEGGGTHARRKRRSNRSGAQAAGK